MSEPTDEELKVLAKEINNCFDNGCGCCSQGKDDIEEAISLLRSFKDGSWKVEKP